jgi:hypothetical protein
MTPQEREQYIRERVEQWRANDEPAYALGDYFKVGSAVLYLLRKGGATGGRRLREIANYKPGTQKVDLTNWHVSVALRNAY